MSDAVAAAGRGGPAPAGLALASPAGRWVLLAAILGSALAGIDATVVNVALPAVGESLDTDFAALQWTVSAYALTLAAFVLLGGALGDRFGQRRVFLVGVVWFAVASLACGLAQDPVTLIAARTVQGVGAALLTPSSLALLQVEFRAADRARAIGAWSGLGGVATAIGPLLGGWLVDVGSWRWVFLINLPLAVVVVWLALRHVPAGPGPRDAGAPVDWAGGLLAAVALGGLTFALIEYARGPLLVGLAVGLAVVGAVAFVFRERRAADPVLPFATFGSGQFRAVNGVTFCVYGGFGVVFFLLVVHLQQAAGFSAVAAGSALLPVTALMLLLSSRAGALAARIGPRLPMTVGPMVCAVGLLLLADVGPGDTYLGDVLPGVLVFGLGLATLVAPLTAAALAAAPAEQAGTASGVNNAVARTGGLVAVAAIPVLAGFDGGDPNGFRDAMWISAGILLVGALAAALTVRNDVLDDDPGAGDDDTPADGGEHLRHCGVGAPPLTTRAEGRGSTA